MSRFLERDRVTGYAEYSPTGVLEMTLKAAILLSLIAFDGERELLR